MAKLTGHQRSVLAYLDLWHEDGPHPSGHMRTRWNNDPGGVLRRLEARGLVSSNGVVMPEGKVYAITDAGREALKQYMD